MNSRIIGIIIRREYLNRVKKKSFLITTFLVPVLFAAMCLLPSLIMFATKEESKTVAVCDASGIVMPVLENTETVTFADCSGTPADSVKYRLAQLGYDAVLQISPLDSSARTVDAAIYSLKPLGVDMTENIGNRIDYAVEEYRIASYNIEGLGEIMDEVKADVRLMSYTIDEEDGEEKAADSGVYMLVSMILGMVIYMFIAVFGGMVMSSVIEEKSSRVVEVLISSVKATELMFGKIIGIAMVALTQFLLWVVLTLAIVGVVGAIAGPSLLSGSDPAEMAQMAGMDPAMAETAAAAVSDSGEASILLSLLANIPFGQIIVCFIIFFVFGYMLYASLFAAIGSAVENEGDTQQLQLPLTIPLLVAFFIALYAFKAPDSGLVFWGSIIPFTSPIVMLARLPFGVPVWEIVLSVVLLIAAFALFAWISAKIYKVGILMFGKKSTWKDLWKWFKQK